MSSSDEPIDVADLVGFSAHLDLHLVEWSENFARMEVKVRDIHLNRSGIVHGGLYATLLDAAAGYTGVWTPPGADPKRAITLSLTTNYLGKTAAGKVICTSRCIGSGRSIFYAEGSVHDDQGQLLATGQSTHRIRTTWVPPAAEEASS